MTVRCDDLFCSAQSLFATFICINSWLWFSKLRWVNADAWWFFWCYKRREAYYVYVEFICSKTKVRHIPNISFLVLAIAVHSVEVYKRIALALSIFWLRWLVHEAGHIGEIWPAATIYYLLFTVVQIVGLGEPTLIVYTDKLCFSILIPIKQLLLR
jgi:hypothetical protein